MEEKYALVDAEIERLEHTHLPPSTQLAAFLTAHGTEPTNSGVSLADLLRRPQLDYAALAEVDPARPALPRAVAEQVQISLKYAGYIKRQLRQAEEYARMENRRIPPDTDYSDIPGVRLEARQKLAKIQPANFGQASRISGVSPADIAALMVWLDKPKNTGT